jgi:hypothetical protein
MIHLLQRSARTLKISERSLTEYHYKEPSKADLIDFIVENKVGKNKFLQFFIKIKMSLTQSEYFESLFPSIKEQKPGFDLYAPMAFIQVLIIVYMIFFYTRMDPDYSNFSSGGFTPTTFNAYLLLYIFIQIIIMILDRYLYLSRDFVVIDQLEAEEEEDSDSEADLEHSDSLSQFDRKKTFDLRSQSGENLLVRGFGLNKKSKFKVNKADKAQDLDDIEFDESDLKDDKLVKDKDIRLSKTNFNKTIVMKYYLQLFTLLLFHILTFWVFPIRANMDLQVTAYCQYNNAETGKNCNEVRMNAFLVLFYLLYCVYFAISSLQIRYGLPELRKGNFAMKDTGPINKGMFQGYLAAPFVMELKIISEWTFTKTSLDLFQWIKFENIYGDLFIAK